MNLEQQFTAILTDNINMKHSRSFMVIREPLSPPVSRTITQIMSGILNVNHCALSQNGAGSGQVESLEIILVDHHGSVNILFEGNSNKEIKTGTIAFSST